MNDLTEQVNHQDLVEYPWGGTGSAGCGWGILFAFSAVWITLGTGLTQLLTWVIEQMVFEGSLGVPNLRVLIALVYGFAMLLPFGLLLAKLKVSPLRNYFHLWVLSGIFTLSVSTARIAGITAYFQASLLQVAGMSCYIIGIGAWTVIRGKKPQGVLHYFSGGGRGLLVAITISGVLIYPWIIWGALGSSMDLFSSTLVCLLFGFIFSWSYYFTLHQRIVLESQSYRLGNLLIDGLAVSFALLIMTAGLGQSGNQILLVLTIPILGWACTALSLYGKQHNGGMNWLAVGILPAIALFWGLTWFDPDELMFVSGSGQGEVMGVSNRAAVIGFGLGAAVTLLIVWFRRTLEKVKRLPILMVPIVVLIWSGAVGLYFRFGQPGFYGDRLFVVMENQLDVSEFSEINNYDLRREGVYQALVDHADETQEDLRSVLNRYKISYRPYYLVNGMEVQAGPLIRHWLETRPEVGRVLDSPVLRPLPSSVPVSEGSEEAPITADWNLEIIHADRVWEDLKFLGSGIVVGQSDSGVQYDHPELFDSYRGKDGEHDYNWYDPWYHSAVPVDIHGHGTHTLGSVLGNQVGVAPDATWIGCTNLARNLGNPPLYLECMQFMLAPFPQDGNPLMDGDASLGAHVLNNSWGCPEVEGCDAEVFLPAVKAMRSAGIFVVVGAGNSGYAGCGSVNAPPAIYDEVFSVGAVNSSGELTSFSSLGPVTVDGSDRLKPDIIAPGARVLSSFPNSTYEYADGTSMAGPHVVGVVALMWSANPDLIGEIAATEKILQQTALPYNGAIPVCVSESGDSHNAAGYGIVNAYAAVELALLFDK
jgi:subtilisin family serine protease